MGLKPNAKRNIKQGECESAAYRGVGTKCHTEKAVDEQKPNCWVDARSRSCTKKHLPLQRRVRTRAGMRGRTAEYE